MPQKQPPESTAVSCPVPLASGASTTGAGRGETLPAWACRQATTEVKTAAKAKKTTLCRCFEAMVSSTKLNPYFFTNFIAAEFMQYRSPVGRGPSGKTWPKCASQRGQETAILRIP